MDAFSPSDVLLFGAYRFDPRGGLYRRGDDGGEQVVSIGSRALALLGVLTERPGDLVSKDAIMSAVWPGTVVEEGNLSVQISTLRRVLDAGSNGQSCIQTVSGRGYRFVLPVARATPAVDASRPAADTTSVRVRPRLWHLWAAGSVAASIALVLVIIWQAGLLTRTAVPPRLSVVVLPFENLSSDSKDDYLADGITDDLTADLSQIPGVFVIASQSAYTYKGKTENIRQIAQDLGVRYVLGGSVRRLGPVLRVDVQLTSGETGANLWSDRFDEPISELSEGQEQIVTRMRSELGVSLFEIERVRSLREHPTNPDAFDLILRARALYNQPPNVQRHVAAQALFERALALDPSSITALTWVVLCLLESADRDGWGSLERMQRVEQLVGRAREIAPETRVVLGATFQWLRAMGRCHEAIPVADKLIERFPNYALGYAYLGSCKLLTGHAEEDLPLEAKATQLDPRDPNMFLRYWRMGTASVLLGRDQDAIRFLEYAIALEGDYGSSKAVIYRSLAVAFARVGRMDEASRSLAESNRAWPYDTIRSHYPDDPSSEVLAEQVRHYRDGLRLAGQRDHADEDADFGVASDASLHSQPIGRTPKDAPGVRTISTPDLARLLTEARPIIIDTATNSWGRSIPGAVGLKHAGIGGNFADAAQDRLREKMRALTGGDLERPVVAVGWNSERFDGRNLALRLAALGYAHVHWYRGGREAWEVAGLPETTLDVQEW